MTRFSRSASVAFLVIAWLFCRQSPAAFGQQPASQAGKLDLTFVPGDAVAAAFVHPRAALTTLSSQWWFPIEVVSTATMKEWGFDLVELERAMVVFGLPDPTQPRQEPQFGCVLQFNKPIDAGTLGRKIVPRGHPADIQGRKALVADQFWEMSCALVDDRTLLIASEPGLNWLLTARPVDSTLRKLMTAADASAIAGTFVAIEPLREMLLPALDRAQEETRIPPPLAGLTQLPRLVDTIELQLAQTGERTTQFTLQLSTQNEQAAGQVVNILRQALQLGKALLINQITSDMMRVPEKQEVTEATLRWLNRISDHVIAMLEPKVDGSRVMIRADMEGGPGQIGVLTALLLPAVQSAREAASRSQSQNNLKQIGLAMHNHAEARGKLPPGASVDANGKPLLSWRVHLLPYIEEFTLYKQFKLDEPWDSPHNIKLLEHIPAAYRHPKLASATTTLYLVPVGPGTIFENVEGRRIRDITDGLAHTIMCLEVSPELAVPWTKPADWEFAADQPLRGLGHTWPGGNLFLALFADGHVESLATALEPEVVKGLITANGEEPVRLPSESAKSRP